jgi:arylformamidase
MVDDLSAMRHIDKIHTPVVIGVGALETPEFLRQAREFAAALKAAGKSAELIVAPGYNHYEIGETIGHPYAVLGRAAMDMMGLNKG